MCFWVSFQLVPHISDENLIQSNPAANLISMNSIPRRTGVKSPASLTSTQFLLSPSPESPSLLASHLNFTTSFPRHSETLNLKPSCPSSANQTTPFSLHPTPTQQRHLEGPHACEGRKKGRAFWGVQGEGNFPPNPEAHLRRSLKAGASLCGPLFPQPLACLKASPSFIRGKRKRKGMKGGAEALRCLAGGTALCSEGPRGK